MIVKEDIAFIKPARYPERVKVTLNFSGVNYPRLRKGSEGHRNGDSTDGIVDYLVPVENLYGISPRPTPYLYSDHLVIGLEEFGLAGPDKLRVQDSRYAVFRGTAGKDFVLGNDGIIYVKGGQHKEASH